VARSGNAPGNVSAAGAGIIFRTANAGGGEFDRVTIDGNGSVGIGITRPSALYTGTGNLVIAGSAAIGYGGGSNQDLTVFGLTYIRTLGTAGSTPLCQNSISQIATCSSSLRYKKDVARFASGLD